MQISLFKAFRSLNYRLFFSGQSLSLIGTWMQRTAVYWLIYMHTHSPFMLGLAVFAAQFPSFLFSPVGGVASDRYHRHRLLLLTQIASMVQAVLLMVVVLFTKYSIAEIYILSTLLGIINAFDVPARQSLIHELVDHKEDLPNAIALNSTMVNLAWIIGPAISGIVLESWGAGICFLINAGSFVAVIVSLLLMRLPAFVPRPHRKKALHEFKEGWRYLKRTPSIGLLILLLACVSLLVLPFSALLPVYAKVIFKGNASTYGYLNSFIGLGAIGGAIMLATLKAGVDLRKVLFIFLMIFGAGLILFSHMSYFPLALVFATLLGLGLMSQTTVSNTIIQTSVSGEMRGRVMSYFAMAFFGMQPMGGLLIGTVSQHLGAPNTLLLEGLAAVLIALVFLPFLRKDPLKEKDKIVLLELEDPAAESTL